MASYKGKPAGPNSVSIFSMMIASCSITLGFVEAVPCFTNPLITIAGVIRSASIIITSAQIVVVLGSPILSARKGKTILADHEPTLKALPNALFIKLMLAFTKLALLSFQSFCFNLINRIECSSISSGIPSANSQSQSYSYP